MFKIKRRLLGLMLSLSMIISIVPIVYSAEIIDGGPCGIDGDNLTWTLDGDGTLTISGTGAMENYFYGGAPNINRKVSPWTVYREDQMNINKVVIEDGVTSIGEAAFYSLVNLASITIPDSVINIDKWAFADCSSLTSIKIPQKTTFIGEGVFKYCYELAILEIPSSIKTIGELAFRDCHNLKNIYYTGTSEQWKEISIGPNNELLDIITIHYNSHIPNNTHIASMSVRNSTRGTYKVSVQIENIETDCELIIALYNNDVLVETKRTKLSPGEVVKEEATIKTPKATSAKCFIWNDLPDMQPLCESKTTTIE